MFSFVTKRNHKMRSIRLTIKQNGEIIVSAPYFISQAKIDHFVQSKSAWINKKLEYFKKHPVSQERLFLKTLPKSDFDKNKEKARDYIQKRVEDLAGVHDFEFNEIYIRNQKSRWGSCSRDKNLSFNYKIIYLPQKIADYIIIHELCHTKELNHSKRFWDLVEKCMPDYLKFRKDLKRIY